MYSSKNIEFYEIDFKESGIRLFKLQASGLIQANSPCQQVDPTHDIFENRRFSLGELVVTAGFSVRRYLNRVTAH